MRILVGALLVVVTALTAPAAPVLAAGPSWFLARSPNFEVYATGSPARAADALVMFENARAFFSSYFALPESTRAPIRVLVFSGKKEFAPYRTNEADEAFYQPARDRDYVVMKDFNGDAFSVVAHEYVHAALGLKGLDLPPWLAEGLAEFFSSVSLLKDKARLGAEPKGRTAALEKSRLMKVANLLAVTRQSEAYNTSDHAGLFYAESWALTHMLMVDKRYRDGAPKLIALAQTGMDSSDVLQQIFGKTTSEVDRDLWRYVSGGRYAFVTMDFAAPPLPQATPPVAVAEFDSSLVVADMLAAKVGKDLEARSMLDALDRERPDDLALTETRAFFELRSRGFTAADPYFKRAVDAGSQNATLLAQYALRIANNEPDRASALLDRALVLAPNDAEIRIHAAAMLIRRDRPTEALTLIGSIGHVPSEMAFEYYQILANARFIAGDFAGAAAAGAHVVAAARTPEQVAFASTFLATVDAPPEVSRTVDGRIKNLNCDGALPVMDVATSTGVIRLAIDDPTKIMIAGGGKLDLDCGAQDVPVRVGYADIKPPDGTAGRIRFLDFRKKTPAF